MCTALMYIFFNSEKRIKDKDSNKYQQEQSSSENRQEIVTLISSSSAEASLNISADKVFLVESLIQWKTIHPLLFQHLQYSKVLGFDCEWITDRVEKKAKPVSLLQLATFSGVCVLLRLHLLEELPASLLEILSDKSILKVGVASIDDGFKLQRDYGIEVCGCVDLRYLALRCGFSNTQGFGLKNLANIVLGVTLDKSTLLRASNWEAKYLSRDQVIYGAKDAAVGAFIFWRLLSIKLNSAFFFHPLDQEFITKLPSFCQGIIDQVYRDTTRFKGSGQDHQDRIALKASNIKEHKNRAYVARQSPLYHNCQMVAPDGQLLCTCDIKKANWYIDKGLAEKISDDPLIVKLTFEPSGRPLEEENYYTQDKLNICVVCGAEDSYIRKSIIPHEYRKFFPPVMKKHRSHDILLMCLQCHQRSNVFDTVIKKQLVERCNAPQDSDKKYTSDNNLLQVKSAARALLNSHHGKCNIPVERLAELELRVKDFYGVSEICDDLLKSAKDINFKVKSDNYTPHGQKVVEYVSQNEGLIDFEKMWRQRFIDHMQPKFLPPLWSVDHHHYQLTDLEYKIKVAAEYTSENVPLKFLKS